MRNVSVSNALKNSSVSLGNYVMNKWERREGKRQQRYKIRRFKEHDEIVNDKALAKKLTQIKRGWEREKDIEDFDVLDDEDY